MTTKEFSDSFDTLLASYNHKSEFGDQSSYADVVLNEYEKSVFLTLAQDRIIKSFFDRRNNSLAEGFDDSIRRQIDFSSLITVVNPVLVTTLAAYDSRGVLYKLPSNVLLILNESIESTNNKHYVVVPISYKEYDRQMSRAYSQPLKKQCWRLFEGETSVNIISEIIPKEGVTISSYKIRYIRRPNPIILTDLGFGEYQEPLKIEGISTVTECELNPILHREILEEAVQLALNSKGIETREQKAAREAANRS